MAQQMDEIDQKQQKEIEALKEVDIKHDKKDIEHDAMLTSTLGWFKFGIKFVSWVFTLWVIISSTLIFILINKLDKCH